MEMHLKPHSVLSGYVKQLDDRLLRIRTIFILLDALYIIAVSGQQIALRKLRRHVVDKQKYITLTSSKTHANDVCDGNM